MLAEVFSLVEVEVEVEVKCPKCGKEFKDNTTVEIEPTRDDARD